MEIETGYVARSQFIPLHTRKSRWAVAVAHRRAGKTVACINDLLDAALRCDLPDPRFAYIAPLYTQAKDVAWGYVKRYGLTIPGAKENESELRLDLPGGRRLRLYGADNYDRLRGGYLDGVILDEYADMDPRAWSEVIRPMLADRKGWAVFIGTPKGRNGFWEVWDRAGTEPDWFRIMLKASETGLLDQAELDDARRAMTPEQYEQEFECSFQAAIQGAYFGREMQAAETDKRIARVPWEPKLQVHTAWDLGIGDSTAIWFIQVTGNEIRWIDYLEGSGVGLDWYVKQLKDKPYTYDSHLLPHDAEVRELGSGQSRVETLQSLGLNNIRVIPAQRKEDQINALRLVLPRSWFDAEKCKRGIEALRQYRAEWDDKRKAFRERPLHDWTSHPADAAMVLAQAVPQPVSAWAKPIKYTETGVYV